VRLTGVEQDALGGSRFTGVNVSNDPNVADPMDIRLCSMICRHDSLSRKLQIAL
jgi:hypothetical protein